MHTLGINLKIFVKNTFYYNTMSMHALGLNFKIFVTLSIDVHTAGLVIAQSDMG
jgi:hypothetical protein